MLGLYVHIPFCKKKCSYCAFSSFSCLEKIDEYVKALVKEIDAFHNTFNDEGYKTIDSIFIGGGTPSLLEKEQIKPIFEAIKRNFNLSKELEFTIECNPNSLTDEKLQYYKENGINRISIGVQSLQNDQLEFVGRLHNKDEAIDAIKRAKKYFDNISCDLLIGLKGASKEEFVEQLDVLSKLGIKHFSTYMLQIEEDTPLSKIIEKEPMILPDDDECVEIYNACVQHLKKLDFERYEVSNFAQKGYECKHNMKYWTGEEYAGFGSSAHSLLCGTRYANADGFADYYAGKKVIEKLSKNHLIEEHIMLGLRCKMGISREKLKTLGYEIDKCSYLQEFIDRGILLDKGDKIFINPEFYGVNNYIIASLLP